MRLKKGGNKLIVIFWILSLFGALILFIGQDPGNDSYQEPPPVVEQPDKRSDNSYTSPTIPENNYSNTPDNMEPDYEQYPRQYQTPTQPSPPTTTYTEDYLDKCCIGLGEVSGECSVDGKAVCTNGITSSFCKCVNEENSYQGCCSHHGGMSGYSYLGRVICNDGELSPSCTDY